MNKEKFNIGGQAVIEGVMMRAPGQFTVAVRTSEGNITVRRENISIDRNPFFKKPFLRGLIGIYDSLILGIKALNFSVQQSGVEGEKPITKKETALSLVLGFGLGILLFVFIPLWLTDLSKHIVPAVERSFLLFNAVDGIIRVIFFVIYIIIISRMKDIQRVFEYHGAEHKSIFAYEEEMELSVENARKMSRFHPRCGTSFLLIVMIVAIIIFSMIPKDSAFIIKLASRILFLPVIAGVSYEILKLSGKYSGNVIVKMLITPGLWLQRLTTREPDDSQLEVAIISIKAALSEDNAQLDGITYV
ncbi:MAG: DUF1385 domain-containing protein [Deferribacteraceae bacterium]|jgi:uncharacterized protein YqhQ|nr:DUF1385 domain-containing protein [Deferribacteraceae bacterium]